MEECHEESVMLEREGKSRQERFYNEGYRESIEDGKARLMQAGFDVGFAAGAEAGLAWGRMLAIEKTLRTYACIGHDSRGVELRDRVLELTALLGTVDQRQVMLAAMKEILSKVPDDAAIRDAAMTEEAEHAQEPVTDEELSIASKLIPGLVEVGNRNNRSCSSSASMNLLGLELEVLRLRNLALSMTSSESEN